MPNDQNQINLNQMTTKQESQYGGTSFESQP